MLSAVFAEANTCVYFVPKFSRNIVIIFYYTHLWRVTLRHKQRLRWLQAELRRECRKEARDGAKEVRLACRWTMSVMRERRACKTSWFRGTFLQNAWCLEACRGSRIMPCVTRVLFACHITRCDLLILPRPHKFSAVARFLFSSSNILLLSYFAHCSATSASLLRDIDRHSHFEM